MNYVLEMKSMSHPKQSTMVQMITASTIKECCTNVGQSIISNFFSLHLWIHMAVKRIKVED